MSVIVLPTTTISGGLRLRALISAKPLSARSCGSGLEDTPRDKLTEFPLSSSIHMLFRRRTAPVARHVVTAIRTLLSATT